MTALHSSDTEIKDYSRPTSVKPKSAARPASVRRKAPPSPEETSTAAEETETDTAAPAPPLRQSGGFLSYLGFGNGREQAQAAPSGSRALEEPTSSDAPKTTTGPSGTDSSDFVDYTTAGEGRAGAQRTGMFGGARRDLTSTDEETGPEGPFSDDAGYAAPVRGGHERVQHFGRGSGSPRKAAVMSDSEDYTGSDVPMQAYDPKAPRPARVDESEGECYAHLHIAPTYPELTTTSRIMLEISQFASFVTTALAFNGLVIYALALYAFHNLSPFYKFPPQAKIDKAWERRITGERFSARTEYYIEFWGYDCEVHDVETEDGFILRLFRIVSRKHRRPGAPVLINHGLLSSSATWVVTEEKSLPFILAERGYDVWLGNIRTNYNMPHRKWKAHDPQYHSWAYREIALYDVPAQIEYIYSKTGQKIRYVGHSQGAGTLFLALSNRMRPDIGDKLEAFAACAPAVYAGTALYKFPLSILRRFTSRSVWQLVFGKRVFYPIINLSQQFLPGWLFGHIAVPVFHGLFGFHPHNWTRRQIPKFFRTVPVGNSSELLYFYLCNFAINDCVFDVSVHEPWFNKSMPRLGVFYGELDTLVKGAPLVQRINDYEPHVDMRIAKALPTYEHQDFLWGANAVEDVYLDIIRLFEMDSDRKHEYSEDFDKESKRSTKSKSKMFQTGSPSAKPASRHSAQSVPNSLRKTGYEV